MSKSFHSTHQLKNDNGTPSALRTRKSKSTNNTLQFFCDIKQVDIKLSSF